MKIMFYLINKENKEKEVRQEPRRRQNAGYRNVSGICYLLTHKQLTTSVFV
nr:MAG TPA: hypothetical protein [Caudoviricetes sp.]